MADLVGALALDDVAAGLRALPVLRAGGREWPVAAGEVTATTTGLETRFADGTVLRLHRSEGRLDVEVTAGSAGLQVDEVGVRLERPGRTRILVDGYNSWDWCGLRDATRDGQGWWGAIWGNPGEAALAIALAGTPQTGALALRWDGSGLDARTAGLPRQEGPRTGRPTALGIDLRPGQSLAAEGVTVAPLDIAAEQGAALPAPPLGAPAPQPRESGWLSWNCYGTRINARRILGAAELVPRGGLVLLDDGWMDRWGDWTVRPAFGASLEEVARRLRILDRKLGLWIAPFLVDVESQTAREHPEWLLRDANGRAIVDSLPARPQHVLDTSREDVRAYLAALGGRLARAGVHALKIDYIYAAGTPGGSRAGGMTDIAALRAGVAAIAGGFRAAAAPGARVYACGAPAPAVLGLVDANRSGSDAIQFVPPRRVVPVARFQQDANLRAAQRRNLDARAWLWGSTMPPDADGITVGRLGVHRPADGVALREWVELGERSGGPFLLSDRPERLSEARRRALMASLVRAAGSPPIPVRPPDPLAGTPTLMAFDRFDAPVPVDRRTRLVSGLE
jgi:alpha-galactosidase